MKKIKDFINEVVAEMKKVVWPKKNVLWVSTWMVIIVALFFGITLGMFDRLFSYLFRLFF
ncbi:MAG: preprotein translocase subunit SecE [Candidatus Mcinerneyibacterium aminivorans]|uniref:Protein translocase subunit SecE n=1 Tax=Candidatus Mcinerneyibacterium aminivorans TaxID=2703815 RepID=A0A5D0MGP6_9BACT|nr:MAG: preprotein translocase subunit SecE [Candidatus Mcinerneyibacterium aminivorans]